LNIGKNTAESKFATIILDEIGNFMSSNQHWISSYRAEIFRLLSSIIILPHNSESIIETYEKLIDIKKFYNSKD
jgi:hypothetical protein